MTDEYAIELIRRAKKRFFEFDKVQMAFDRAIELLEAQRAKEEHHEDDNHDSDNLYNDHHDLLDRKEQ